MVCATPSFAGETSVEVRDDDIARDPECGFCSRLLVEVLEDGEMVYPLAVQTEEMEPNAQPAGGTRRLSITAFVEQIEIWDDEAAYDAASTSPEVRFAAQSLIPVGTFPPDFGARRRFRRPKRFEPTAHALVTGVVNEARLRRNSATGRDFAWGTLDSLAATYDVVASAEAVAGGFSPGNVVQATCWLIGRSAD